MLSTELINLYSNIFSYAQSLSTFSTSALHMLRVCLLFFCLFCLYLKFGRFFYICSTYAKFVCFLYICFTFAWSLSASSIFVLPLPKVYLLLLCLFYLCLVYLLFLYLLYLCLYMICLLPMLLLFLYYVNVIGLFFQFYNVSLNQKYLY